MGFLHKIFINILLKILRRRAREHIVTVIVYMIRKVCPAGRDKHAVMNEIHQELLKNK